jgi:CMP-N-acetylneuraminic acid synthetase
VTKTLCIIPARGGSKRIPRKNLLPFAGKPLLAYTVEAALQSEIFADVVVSSEDDEILQIAAAWGATPDRRPASLSDDTTRFVEVVAEYLERPEMRQAYETVASLLPTCPFRTVADLQAAWNTFNQGDRQGFLIAVTEYDFPPQLALDFAADGLTMTMRDPAIYGRTTRSQSLGKAYHPNGAIYLTTVEAFLRERTFFGEPLLGYSMPPERSLDIDYPYQFKIAEYLMQEIMHKH